jgi:pteridine reductase
MNQAPLPLEKPVAFVTGSAANRVGRVIANQFAQHGYRIVLHANQSVEEGKRLVEQWTRVGLDAHLVVGSITDEATVSSWIAEILDRFGRLDCLVHAAATWEPKRLEETTPDDLRSQWEVNTLGSFLCAQKAGLAMAQQSTGGAIVLIGDWATRRPYSDFTSYFVSKGCIPTLTRSLAIELANRNPHIRVNAILPGPVMLDEKTPETTKRNILEASLLKTSGTAEHVAQAALFLAEHRFLTGVCLPVDGGRSIYASEAGDAIAHPSLFNPNFETNQTKH